MKNLTIEEAYEKRVSDITLTIEGAVSRILPDDHKGIHHQKFVVAIPEKAGSENGRTVLVAHNLERAYRSNVKVGDRVEVRGTYVWNKFGGILHNTHHDDHNACRKLENGKTVCGPLHEDGWIIFAGKKDPHRTK